MREACGRGEREGVIRARVEGWRRYCGSALGRSIRAPGFLTAARIGEGVDPPVAVETQEDEAWAYIQGVLEEARGESGPVGGVGCGPGEDGAELDGDDCGDGVYADPGSRREVVG
jgi:hypothetical protein